MLESKLPDSGDLVRTASADQRRRERDAGLDELVRISEKAGLYDDAVIATRVRR